MAQCGCLFASKGHFRLQCIGDYHLQGLCAQRQILQQQSMNVCVNVSLTTMLQGLLRARSSLLVLSTLAALQVLSKCAFGQLLTRKSLRNTDLKSALQI
jgi:hypothetical protein